MLLRILHLRRRHTPFSVHNSRSTPPTPIWDPSILHAQSQSWGLGPRHSQILNPEPRLFQTPPQLGTRIQVFSAPIRVEDSGILAPLNPWSQVTPTLTSPTCLPPALLRSSATSPKNSTVTRTVGWGVGVALTRNGAYIAVLLQQ